jgi:peptidyl-prolyl cis-trans isomerase C
MKKNFLLALSLYLSICGIAAADTDNPAMATVNGVDITRDEVTLFIAKQGKPVPPQMALQEMINVELLVQAARNDKLLDDKTLQLELKRNESALIASYYLQQQLAKMDISEQQLRQRYQQEYLDAQKTTEYNASHILVKTEQEAKDVIKQLDQGANFPELAKTLSIGPSGKEGGALGWFKDGDMVPSFFTATTQLKPGHYSKQPVQTQFGWHIIFLNETRAIEPPAFETVSKQLSTAIAAESINNQLNALRDKASIKFNQAQ